MFLLDLQFFTEGGEGGVSGTPTSQSVEGGHDDGGVTQRDFASEFDALIKGDFKDEYNKRVSQTVQKRLKGTKEMADNYKAITPTIELLARKYGVDASDLEGLAKAVEADDTYYEDEALRRGITVEEARHIDRMERENAQLKAQMEERQRQENADRIYAGWMQEAESVQMKFPSFNLDAELDNPDFIDLLMSGVGVETAYKVLHFDDIVSSGMQYTAQQVQSNIASSLASNGRRPAENGSRSRSSSVSRIDVSKLTDAQLDEFNRRAMNGERITFR